MGTTMKFFKLVCILLSALTLVTAKGYAETFSNDSVLTDDSLFAIFLRNNIPSQLYRYALMMDEKLGVESDEEYLITPGDIRIYMPIEIQPRDQYPSSGIWTHRFELTRGNKTRTYNICFVAQKNAPPKIVRLIMGNTRTSPLLEIDALPIALLTVAHKKQWTSDEKDFYDQVIVTDAKMVKPPHTFEQDGVTYEGVWGEEWTFKAYGEETIVNILFVPDKNGETNFYCSTE